MVQGFISSQKSDGGMEFRHGLIRALAHQDSPWFTFWCTDLLLRLSTLRVAKGEQELQIHISLTHYPNSRSVHS